MELTDKIFIAGHRGMVGSAIQRNLENRGYTNILTQTRQELDLCDAAKTFQYLKQATPDVVIIAAARVGGIHANNTYPAEFLYENLAIAQNLIHSSYLTNVKRLLFLGSACIYPRNAPQPMHEDYLLTSPLEPTNEAYAIAKICGLKLCQFYRQQYGVLFHSAMPNNLYGPGDNYHPENSHGLPALIRRFHEAKENNSPEVAIWGTGSPRREFLYVEDLADGIFHILNHPTPPDWVNLGIGADVTIKEVAEIIKDVVQYKGNITFDSSKPDGTPRKLLDTSKMEALGWKATTGLKEGIKAKYQDFCKNYANNTVRVL